MRIPNPFAKSSAPPTCSSCGHSVEGEQLACLQCGGLLSRSRRAAGAGWQAPATLALTATLLLATGIGYASGAVARDGELSIAEVPAPRAPALPGADEDGGDGQGNGNGGGDLADLPDLGGGGGSALKDLVGGPGDGDGNGDGGGNGGGDGDGGGNGGGNGDGGGNNASGDRSDGKEKRTKPRPQGPETFPDFDRPVALETFPTGVSAYTVVLGSYSTERAARRRAEEAAGQDVPAGVVRSSDFPGLPGRFVAFAGRFSSKSRAEDENDFEYAGLGQRGTVTFLDGAGTGEPSGSRGSSSEAE